MTQRNLTSLSNQQILQKATHISATRALLFNILANLLYSFYSYLNHYSSISCLYMLLYVLVCAQGKLFKQIAWMG